MTCKHTRVHCQALSADPSVSVRSKRYKRSTSCRQSKGTGTQQSTAAPWPKQSQRTTLAPAAHLAALAWLRLLDLRVATLTPTSAAGAHCLGELLQAQIGTTRPPYLQQWRLCPSPSPQYLRRQLASSPVVSCSNGELVAWLPTAPVRGMMGCSRHSPTWATPLSCSAAGGQSCPALLLAEAAVPST
jgi:hypothetical protein